MKKMMGILTLSFFFTLASFADHWQEKWSEAALLLQKKEFTEAKPLLVEAIRLMETGEGQPELSLYVDLARLNLLLGNESESLENLKNALENKDLSNRERTRAIATKIIVSTRLGIFTSLIDDLNEFAGVAEVPSLLVQGKKLIVRDVPKSCYYRKLMSCFLIHSKFAYDLDEINWLRSDLIANTHCGCQVCVDAYNALRQCDACHATLNSSIDSSPDDLILALFQYVSREVTQLEDQKASLSAIYQIYKRNVGIELFPNTLDLIFEGLDKPQPFFD